MIDLAALRAHAESDHRRAVDSGIDPLEVLALVEAVEAALRTLDAMEEHNGFATVRVQVRDDLARALAPFKEGG